MDDAELLNRYCRDGSQEAFAELVHRHLPLVYHAACRRLGGDAHRAQDVAQTVFAELARHAGDLARRPAIEGWLFTTTRNVTIQCLRAERRRLNREQAAVMNDPGATEPPVNPDELRPVIDDVIDDLSERDRDVVLARFFRGAAFAEIARNSGISEDAARFRVNRALDRMRTILTRRGITSTTTALTAILAQQATAAVGEGMTKAVTAGALAQAATVAPGAGALSLLATMTTTKAAIVAALVTTGVGGFWVHRDLAVLNAAKAELAAQTTEYQAAVAGLKATKHLAAASPTSASLTTSGSLVKLAPVRAVPAPGGESRQSATAGSSSSRAADDVNWAVSRNPEVRATLATFMKAMIHANMSAFYRQANLAPDQIAALEDLLSQNNVHMGPDMVLALRPEGKTVPQLFEDVRRLLGDATYLQCQEYLRTQFLQPVTIGLATAVYEGDAPLTAPVADQLTRILADSASTDRPFPKDIDWSKALPRARALLAPSQYRALEGLAAAMRNTPAALNPYVPGTFGAGLTPPPSFYEAGGTSK